MLKKTLFAAAMLTAVAASAQDSLWTLQRSIRYAVDNNLDVKQSVLNERLAQLQQLQSQLSMLPSAQVSTNVGRSYGRSIDPTSNQFLNAGYTFAGASGNVDVLLFGWFQKQNTIKQNKLLSQSASADLSQLKDDISLNVATAFLRILMAQEQIHVAESQLKYSLKQREQTDYFVKAGRSPELDLAQMEAQVATDSSGYFTALATFQQSVLDMKALMNFEISAPFTPVAPEVNNIPIGELAGLTPEQVFASAQKHFGSIRSNQLKIEASRSALAAAKGALYPQLSLSGQFGTNYASSYRETVGGYTYISDEPSGAYINLNGQRVDVYAPNFAPPSSRDVGFFKQYSDNFRQTYLLNLSIPLFNGWASRTNVNRSKVDVQSKQLGLDQAKLKLKQDVYKAYYDAMAAVQKHYATMRADEASERAYTFAQKRYELGLMNALELLTTQNTAFKAKADALSAKYDLLFKLKVIDYYLGKEIKL
ncbi:TolC family protein [Taibaiella koreensis]|uniref:TolC family protein n=1 Tax=Taibaiella koreensis TaxID=1268548 RepID=UPI0013C32F1E|nr:TolC family protein [Taibaiella koreensis]